MAKDMKEFDELVLLLGEEAVKQKLESRLQEIKDGGSDYVSRYLVFLENSKDPKQMAQLPVHEAGKSNCSCYECTVNNYKAGMADLKDMIDRINIRLNNIKKSTA